MVNVHFDHEMAMTVEISIASQEDYVERDSRIVHLVGSMPFGVSEMPSTMQFLLEKLGGHLISLPDGEPADDIVDRSLWVNTAVKFQNKFESSVFKHESRVGLDNQLNPSVPPEDFATHIGGFGYEHTFNKSFPVFKEALNKFKRINESISNIVFQVGVPTSFSISLFVFKSIFDKFRYMPSVRKALAKEINSIAGHAGHANVLFQIEVPLETIAAFHAIGATGAAESTVSEAHDSTVPALKAGWLRPFAMLIPTSVFYRDLFDFVELLDPSIRVGVHFCLGCARRSRSGPGPQRCACLQARAHTSAVRIASAVAATARAGRPPRAPQLGECHAERRRRQRPGAPLDHDPRRRGHAGPGDPGRHRLVAPPHQVSPPRQFATCSHFGSRCKSHEHP